MITIVNIIDMVVWVYDLQFVLVHCAVFNIACSFLQNAVKHDIFWTEFTTVNYPHVDTVKND